jgi:hypothetical protein
MEEKCMSARLSHTPQPTSFCIGQRSCPPLGIRDASENERKAWCHAQTQLPAPTDATLRPSCVRIGIYPLAPIILRQIKYLRTLATSFDSVLVVWNQPLLSVYSRRLVGLGSPVIESIAHVCSRSSRKVVACVFPWSATSVAVVVEIMASCSRASAAGINSSISSSSFLAADPEPGLRHQLFL